jgi:hypothetical protein
MLRCSCRVLILGPPASGKTAVAQTVAASSGAKWLDLDPYAINVAEGSGGRDAMTDAMIDIAAALLLKAADAVDRCIVELPHHDYMTLGRNLPGLFRGVAGCVLFVCSPLTVIRRNAERSRPVPTDYVERCCEAAVLLGRRLSEDCAFPVLVLNIDDSSERVVEHQVMNFLRPILTVCRHGA